VSARAQILAAQTRKFALAADVDLTAVARALPENVTGADIGAVTAAAHGTALQRKLGELRASAVAAIRFVLKPLDLKCYSQVFLATWLTGDCGASCGVCGMVQKRPELSCGSENRRKDCHRGDD
jgi:SpoVK/Ycf46/Vps4 family AAA+-type ATPase